MANGINAETKKDLSKSTFAILIENTEDGIKVNGCKGCAYIHVTATLQEGETICLDQNGIGKHFNRKKPVKKDKKLASFRMKITKKKGELLLEGHEGTIWTKLSFSCPVGGQQLVDQNGML